MGGFKIIQSQSKLCDQECDAIRKAIDSFVIPCSMAFCFLIVSSILLNDVSEKFKRKVKFSIFRTGSNNCNLFGIFPSLMNFLNKENPEIRLFKGYDLFKCKQKLLFFVQIMS